MITKCQLCGKGKLELFDCRNSQQLYICKKCNVITTGIFLTDEAQKNDSIKFYDADLDLEKIEQAIQANEELLNSFHIYLNNIENKTILDFGCGNGYFLHASKKLGFKRAIGIDVNIERAEQINTNYDRGIEFYTGCNMLKKNTKVDYVVFWHVLEHLENPNSFFRSLKPFLNKDAIIFIQVPQYRKDYVVPSHYWFYSIPAMTLFLRKNGFIKVKYEFDDSNEFFQVIAKYKGSILKKQWRCQSGRNN